MKKLDVILLNPKLGEMAAFVKAAERIGFDGLWTSETNADPILPLAIAAEHSERIDLGTAIAVAFPRSPMTLAYLAWDLARYSDGRFILGLGTQVKAHNVRRFGVKWEKPVRKLREMIEVMHATWDCWENGTPLNYEGEFFHINLMTPFFTSGPLGFERPPIYISAVNKLMLQLAGKRCDGVHIHAFHTKQYLEQFALPHIETGLAKAGRKRQDIALSTALFAVPTDDEAKSAAEHELFAKQQISFYMSTPAYRVVTEMHGWEETAFKLSKMARRGEWAEMPPQISDEILDTMALSGKWAELPRKAAERYGNLLDRVSFYLAFEPGKSEAGWSAALEAFGRVNS